MLNGTTQVLLAHGVAVAKECRARAIFAPLVAACATESKCFSGFFGQIVLLSRSQAGGKSVDPHIITLPNVSMPRLAQIRLAVFLAVSRKLVDPGDLVVFLAGDLEVQKIDTILVTEVASQSQIFHSLPTVTALCKSAQPEVIARMIDLALEIGVEGREGKPVGALFVLGDTDHVLALSRPLVLNPFHGYAEIERNILDVGLEETVKEFAAIDGAFVIRGDGIVEACGVLLKTATSDEHEIPHGLGVRHHVAAGITAVTAAIAIVVSESTGTVTIFMGGHNLIQIEKPRPAGRTSWGQRP